jgi:hypothetical protein
MSELLFDRAGRRRSPATMPGFHAGRPPRNKGLRYPADPPKVEEIVSVMRTAGNDLHGRRMRGLIVVLWRAGLRIQEALALAEADLDHRRGALLVRCGKGDAAVRSAWTRGAGMSSSHGSNYESSYPSDPCSVSSTAGRVVASGRAPPPEASCSAQPSQLGSADGSLHTSCGMPTPSKWLAKACRSWSSSAGSATATSASPRSISKNRQRRDHRHRPRPARAGDPG